jgi:Lrp/AsnC family leucine-responsive transcriptional regulator
LKWHYFGTRRLKRLEETGVIIGYSARINPVALGLGVGVIMTVRLAKQSPADIAEFLVVVRCQPEITECLLVTGNLDYVLRLKVRDVEALRDFILSKIKTIPCVAQTSTMLVLETSKSAETVPMLT